MILRHRAELEPTCEQVNCIVHLLVIAFTFRFWIDLHWSGAVHTINKKMDGRMNSSSFPSSCSENKIEWKITTHFRFVTVTAITYRSRKSTQPLTAVFVWHRMRRFITCGVGDSVQADRAVLIVVWICHTLLRHDTSLGDVRHSQKSSK